MEFQLNFPDQEDWLTKEIAQLEEEYENHPQVLNELRNAHEEMMATLRQKYTEEYEAMVARQNERVEKLRQLRDRKTHMDEQKKYEETIKIVMEICKDFEAFSKGHVYQIEDIVSSVHAYLHGHKGFLNANDMGLGKTYESIVTLYILTAIFERDHGRKPYILWLTKTSILKTGSTTNEFKRWWPQFKIAPLQGSDPPAKRSFVFELVEQTGMAVITNYETVRTTKEARDITWDFVIMDEVHKLKGGANLNGPTAIWETVKNLVDTSRFILMLSGTPMVNRPQEMWAYLHIFNALKFPSIRKFEDTYCQLQYIAGEMQLAVRPDWLLENALKGQMIRRRRDEVNLQLPEVTYIGDEIEILGRTMGWDFKNEFVPYKAVLLEHNEDQSAVYQQMRNDFFVWLDEQQSTALTATAIIAQLTRLRQINVWPAGIKLKDAEGNVKGVLDVRSSAKIDEAMDIIEAANDQVVVFSTFNEPMEEIARRCKEVISDKGVGLNCRVLSGANSKEMDGLEADFQQGKIDVLCVNSAMGEGLNLQKNPNEWPGGSSIAIFLDIWWNPARNEQCEGRIHRQGANQPVMIYRLFVKDSVDYFMLDKVIQKKNSFDSIMESEEIRPASEWKEYLKGLL